MNITVRPASLSDPAQLKRELADGHAVELTDVDALVVRQDDIAALAAQLAEEEGFNMSSFRSGVTGVDNTIWLSHKGHHPRHAARLKVAIDQPHTLNTAGMNASISIPGGEVMAGDPPAWLLNQVRHFIELNRDALLDFWEERIDSGQLQERLKSISK